ncbi:hypothetical protein Pla110_19160 [Polystyrenella longa]|uniref:DUF1501 domain-containing protein n=1 Tax=Polystyrenella longa TaxID=2528007 RepID=A0A518CLU9_9PLAN|nr:DUF1501 domain-containing protein [Polystyrenella longa]QDU80192.1 hypothetical protein Pla110_19160 [Polystyrenella longa]
MFAGHSHQHAFNSFQPTTPEGLVLKSRRNMLKASMAGLAGLSLPGLMQRKAEAAKSGEYIANGKSVILLWMTGGASHIDTWDMKPDRPDNNRGPFSPVATKVPCVHICEHFPLQAAMQDKITIIRSVDCRHSNHEPNMVMQTGFAGAAPRSNRKGDRFPSIASLCSKFRGSNDASMPPYVAFMKNHSHIAFAGDAGKKHDPFIANDAARLPIYDLLGNDTGNKSSGNRFALPGQLSHERIRNRQELVSGFDRLRKEIDQSGSMASLDTYRQQAVDLLIGQKAQAAFDLEQETADMRERYGDHLWCQQTLLARRLVEAGTSFVTLDLSYHSASGTWDNHGIPGGVYGGISKGLKPLLPLFDRLFTTLVSDLEERGKLDDVLVIGMGEFGRTPNMGTQGSQDGRNHWQNCMSMVMAGGGLNHGQVIGATEQDGGNILERPVTPGDLAATIYKHMGVPLHEHYIDGSGRPNFIVENGAPIAELF